MNEILARVGRIEKLQEQLIKTQQEMTDHAKKFQVDSKEQMTMLMDMMNDMIHGGKPLEDPAVNAINEVLNDNDEFDVIVSNDQEPISEYGNSRQLQDLVPRGIGELMVNEESMKEKSSVVRNKLYPKKKGIENGQRLIKKKKNVQGFQFPPFHFSGKKGVKVQCSEIVASTETNVTKSYEEYRAQENEKGNQSKRASMNIRDKAIVTNKNCFDPNFQLINEEMRSDHKTAKKKVEVGTSEESSKRAQIREMIKKWGGLRTIT
ncbi:hypothetical protein F3Y22_tig00110954pilonHSYRG00064 [Hibiscus syriacus]|uniref:Uncharacterized protein n=1 Tax=Hibiscus syriacus TaxID=106335 RepID=A0A6A2ZAR9_HIBSY|nr:hypothetical protein F3Y22_tig00110954pilonHSYRG00064 [Hibiscus syriacus]